jgi:uncharacterized protein YjiS (DUF1127 family)
MKTQSMVTQGPALRAERSRTLTGAFFGSLRQSRTSGNGQTTAVTSITRPARLTVLGRIAATGRQCWAFGRARIAEWRRRGYCRCELRTFSDLELWDIGMTRLDAENKANKPHSIRTKLRMDPMGIDSTWQDRCRFFP